MQIFYNRHRRINYGLWFGHIGESAGAAGQRACFDEIQKNFRVERSSRKSGGSAVITTQARASRRRWRRVALQPPPETTPGHTTTPRCPLAPKTLLGDAYDTFAAVLRRSQWYDVRPSTWTRSPRITGSPNAISDTPNLSSGISTQKS